MRVSYWRKLILCTRLAIHIQRLALWRSLNTTLLTVSKFGLLLLAIQRHHFVWP
jgi:hypothetical protein